MQQYIEEEIIKQLRDPAHQRDAFAQVVNFYGEKLYWQIRKMVLDHDDANDLLQNTFLKAWTNIDYFRGEAKLSTWLYRIALNECLTFLNRQRATATVSLDDPEADEVSLAERIPITPLVAFCYMLFVLIYFPCIAALAAIKQESGSWKWALFAACYTTVLAWIVSFTVYQIGGLFV